MQTLLVALSFVVAYFLLGSVFMLFPLHSCVRTHINAFLSVLQPLGEGCCLQLPIKKENVLVYLQKLLDILQMLCFAVFLGYTSLHLNTAVMRTSLIKKYANCSTPVQY